jgi:hypothetical protein
MQIQTATFINLFLHMKMLFGTVIYRGNVGLIAGYDPDTVTDK